MYKQVGLCALCIGVGIGGIPYAGLAANGVEQAQQQAEARLLAKYLQADSQAPSVRLQQALVGDVRSDELPHETTAFRIHHIDVEAEASFFCTYKQAIQHYEGRRIGPQGINQIARKLQEAIVADGYVTTDVVVPDQDISKGTLVFKIIPGRIETIRFTAPVAWGTWRNAFPTSAGDILNLRDLEQGLEQMKRVANQDVSMKIVPGSKAHTSVVELARTESAPITVGISVDNAGYKETGQWESSVSTAWYNPLGLNDVLSYTYGKDIEHDDASLGSDNYYVSYSIPYGNYIVSASAYRNHFKQTIATVQPYLSSGVTKGQRIGVERLLRRDGTSKTSLRAQVMRRERHNFINDEEIEIQQQKATALEFGVVHRRYAGQTQADIYAFFRKGVGGWGAEIQPWEDGEWYGTPRYSLWGLQTTIQAPLRVGHREGRYRLQLVGQYARMRLQTADQLSIGGRYTVRGFDGERNLSGEYGAYLQQEISLPLYEGQLEPYIGLDVGYVGGPSTEYELGHVLVGTVLGLRGRLNTHISYDVNIGTPLYKPSGFTTGKTTVGVALYAQL